MQTQILGILLRAAYTILHAALHYHFLAYLKVYLFHLGTKGLLSWKVTILQFVADLSTTLTSYRNVNIELAEHRALHNSAITRNAERKVQLTAEYGDEDLDYNLQELEEFQADVGPRLNEAMQALEGVKNQIRVSLTFLSKTYSYTPESQSSHANTLLILGLLVLGFF